MGYIIIEGSAWTAADAHGEGIGRAPASQYELLADALMSGVARIEAVGVCAGDDQVTLTIWLPDPKVCPHCGSSFYHQEGRAMAGQHRNTGVTYCSKKCANTAGQQRRRRSRSAR